MSTGSNLITNGTGMVLPQGSFKPAHSLPEGELLVTISGTDDSGLLRLEYPNGVIKHHQAENVTELAGKVVNALRGLFGVTQVEFIALPESLASGQSFKIKGA